MYDVHVQVCNLGKQRPFGGNVINYDVEWFTLEKMIRKKNNLWGKNQ